MEEIKETTEKLTEEFHTISAKMYEKAQAGQGQDPNMGGDTGGNMGGDAASEEAKNDNVVDAEYEVVDDDKK